MAELVDGFPPLKLLLLGLATSFLSVFIYGYQYSVTGLSSQVLKQYINESQQYQSGAYDSAAIEIIWGLVSGAVPLSVVFGGLLACPLADRCGRKLVLFILNNINIVIGSMLVLISKWTHIWQILLIARVLFGISGGIGVTVTPLYLTECSPVYCRGFMGSLHGSFVYVAAFVAQLLSIKPLLGTMDTWHILVAGGAVPAIIQMVLFLWVPETPQYDFLQNKDGESALRTIQTYFGKRYSDLHKVETIFVEYDHQKGMAPKQNTLRETLGSRSLRPTILLAIIIGASRAATGEYVLTMYTGDMLRSAGVGEDSTYIIGVCMQLAVVVSAWFGCGLVATVSRRRLLLGALTYIAVSWLMVSCLQLIKLYSGILHKWPVYLSLTFMLTTYVIAYPIGCATVTWFLPSELSIQSARASISAISMSAGGFNVFIISLIYPLIASWNIVAAIMMLLMTQLVSMILFLWIRLPETRNRPISDIVLEVQERAGHQFEDAASLIIAAKREEDLLEDEISRSTNIENGRMKRNKYGSMD